MKRIQTALIAAMTLAVTGAAAVTAPAAAQRPNPYVQRMLSLGDLQRRAVLRQALADSGQRCGRVDPSIHKGPFHNLEMFAVRCTPGGDFGVFIGPDGTAQVRSCADLATLKLPTCGLPPAPPPAARRAGGR